MAAHRRLIGGVGHLHKSSFVVRTLSRRLKPTVF
jgi:hypothetical protein